MSEAAATYHHAGPRPFKQRGQYVQEPKHDYRYVRRAARHDNRLTAPARLFFEDVCDLSERDGFCSASQAHFARQYGVDDRTVRNWITALETLGYLERKRVKSENGDGRRKKLVPSRVPPTVESTGNKLPETAKVPENSFQEIPENSFQTPRVYIPPEGGEGAHTHEGPGQEDQPLTVEAVLANLPYPNAPVARDSRAVAIYAGTMGHRPGLTQSHEISVKVGNEPKRLLAWAAVCEEWQSTHRQLTGNTYNLGNVRGMLDRLNTALAEEAASPNGTPAHTPPVKELSSPVGQRQRDAALVAYSLDAGDFYAAGKDRRGEPLYKLRAEVLATLTETAR